MSLISELKRRNVFRAGLLYIVAGWFVLQVADVAISLLSLPEWSGRLIFVIVALGFIPALIFSWVYELTPEGLKREHEVQRDNSIAGNTGRKIDTLIAVFGTLVLVAIVADRLLPAANRTETTRAAPETAQTRDSGVLPGDNSIAVLPFVNMSADPDQEYFSDGLTEELINLLAKVSDLKVAARSSAFQFKGQNIDIAEVAGKLSVAHVLEGSVRRYGDQLRITTQLIKASDGYHLWSETYDRSFENIFAIQDDIAAEVVKALRVELLGEAPKSEAVDPEAYALFLKGRYHYMQWGKDNFERAQEAFRKAIEIDPDYARAWASLSVTYVSQIQSGYRPREDTRLAIEAVDRALELDPDDAEAWARLSLIRGLIQWDWARAKEAADRALALEPDNAVVLSAAGNVNNSLGDLEQALHYVEKILLSDPLNLISLFNRGQTLTRLGRLDEAIASFRQVLEINPRDWGSNAQVALIYLLQDKPEAAMAQLEKEVDPVQQEFTRILTLYKLDPARAAERHEAFIREHGDWASVLIAQIYAWTGHSDAAFEWLDRAFERRDAMLAELQVIPLFGSLQDDRRWKLLLERMGVPASGLE